MFTYYERNDDADRRDRGKKSHNRLRILILLGIIGTFLIITIFCSFYHVSEQQVAVVTTFGKITRTDTAGLHFKIPYIQKVKKVDTTTHGTGIGYVVDGDGQTFTVDTEGIMITSDFNFIDIDFYMEYRVSDPIQYVYASVQPETVLKNIALAAIRSTVANFTVDDAMTVGKPQIQIEVKEKIQADLSAYNIGLQITNITIQDAEPPTNDVREAFKEVEKYRQGKETAINEARAYESEQLPLAEAGADKITQNSEATKAARIAEAEGQVARFNAMFEQYKLYPDITKKRLYYEVLEGFMPDVKIIITDGTTQTLYPLDTFSSMQQGE